MVVLPGLVGGGPVAVALSSMVAVLPNGAAVPLGRSVSFRAFDGTRREVVDDLRVGV
ncbi:hypothetical protein [Haladaptatus salinisoli]|uniref:hypothetical protein n=1 Tax=Haladaptatus salinisoli TaxID=2884876 RepID=UPI001D0B74F4|nr:hypothetical protein [Haladaptatus salinisoli]